MRQHSAPERAVWAVQEPDEIGVVAIPDLFVSASSEASAPATDLYARLGKRVLDLFLIVLLIPLWVIVYASIVALILLIEGRPAHFRSTRIGRDGKEIQVLKFRTMHVDASSRLASLLAADPALEMEFKQAVKLRSDPRITSVGRFLRRSSLDELPQLFNVLKGDMSLVGPRPVLRSELEEFYGDSARQVLHYRPGLTGLWQVSGRSLLPYEERVALDLQYATSCNLAVDLGILVRTVPSVLAGKGAY